VRYIAGAAALLVVLWAVDWLMRRKGREWAQRLPADERAVLETRYRLLRRVVVAVVLVVGIGAVLLASDRTKAAAQTVLASSAVLGLVIGFAARATLANFVAGLMIAINQPIRLGDRISIGDAEGTVEDIGLTYTRLRTGENRRVLIPNEQLANATVTNSTLVDPVTLAQVRVTVPLAADPGRVRELLCDEAAAAPGRLPDREPQVAVAELTVQGAVYSVGVWTADPASAAAAADWLRERAIDRLGAESLLPTPAEVAT
jgi:small-conductance mechanosensitive channel